MNVSKILKIVSAVISIIAVYFFVKVSTNGDGIETGDVEAVQIGVQGFMVFTAVLLSIILGIIVIFVVLDLIKSPGKIKKTAIGLLTFVVLIFVAYVMADSKEVILNDETIEAGSSLSKNVSAGIILSAILGVIAFGGFIVDSLKSLLK